MSSRLRSLALCSATLVVSLGLAGCGTPRDPVNRVQPNYVDKQQLAGSWYYQRTVVDMPAANGFTFIGATDLKGLSRVVWDIQEGFLYARRHTELVKNADGKGTLEANGGRYLGEVVAAFKIQKHFDIARPYNDSTGEELNVLAENDVDRPWHQRRYMRVDWSQNLVHNYDLDFESASIESVPHYVQEFDPVTGQRNPDAPHFELDQGYFDVTTKLFAQAGRIDYPGYGKVPLCWLDELVECGAAEYTLRHSFKRIDPARRYETRPYKGKETDLFGFYWTDRLVYDAQAGILEQSRERFLNRFNLWQSAYGEDGQLLPPDKREPKPVVYHVNRDWPQDDVALTTAAHTAADGWNAILVDAVRATGNTRLAEGARMFVLCDHNPVLDGDPAECGAPGTSPRIGDLRYSFLAYVPKYMTNGLLGFGPSNVDPETGEIISGMAYVYHHNNVAAFRVQEMVELLNGRMRPDAYVEGLDLADWVAQATQPSGLGRTSAPLPASSRLIAGLSSGTSARFWDAVRQAPTEADEAFQRQHGVQEWLRPYFHELYQRRTILRGDTDGSRGKLARLAGTEIEQMLLNDEIYAGMGVDPRLPLADAELGQASVARGGFARFAGDRERLRQQFAEQRRMSLPEMADDALLGLARELGEKGLSSAQIYETLRRSVYGAVLAHELGHTLGLTHNFGGSDDALNYFDDYWRLRAADGTVRPRLLDPITEEEVDGQLYSYGYSSVMDYAGRYTLDARGPGKYDRAAVLFGYAGKVEVFKDTEDVPVEDFRDWYERDGDVLRFGRAGPKALHYTSYYERMKQKLYSAANRELVDVGGLSEDFAQDGLGRPRVPYIYCSHNRADLYDHCLTRDFGADPAERMSNLIDELDTWYIARNFPRGQVEVSQANYVARTYGRYYGRLKHWVDLLGLYKELLPRFYTSEQLAAFYADPIDGWGSRTWSAHAGFNKLVQTVLTPDIGTYTPSVSPDGKQLLRRAKKSQEDSAAVALGADRARFYSTSWQSEGRECGNAWWECLHHVGFYLDKVMAIEALTDTQTNFVARTTPEDLREWRIGYYGLFAEQIARLNSAILGGDWRTLGPYLKDGALEFPDYAGEAKEIHAEAVDPFATFSVQLYWQVLGMARFPASFDRSFVDESRLFIMGTVGAPQVGESLAATYRDPITLLTYGALRRPQTMGKGAGESLVDYANSLLARSKWCDDRRSTGTFDDDCGPEDGGTRPRPSAGGHTPESVSAMLMDLNELIKTLVLVDSRMNWGSPYDP